MTTSSNRSLRSRTMVLWTLVLAMTLSCTVQAAPEAYHRRQGEPAIVIPSPVINEMDDMGFNDNTDLDPKRREEMAELIAFLQNVYKNEMQLRQGADEENLLETGAMEGLSNMPAALQAKLLRSQEAANKEEIKRGSYQPSLCYFKICNMGRKRNIR